MCATGDVLATCDTGNGNLGVREHLGNALGTPRRQTCRVDTSYMTRTRAGRATAPGRVLLRSHTGHMPSWAGTLGNNPIAARDRLSVAALAFQCRSKGVPEGGRTGGFQTSAPQVRPQALSDKRAASRGHGRGTIVAPDTFGPQRTRGALRTLAHTVKALSQRRSKAPLIHPGDMALDDAGVRAEVLKFAGDSFKAALNADIIHPDSKAVEEDNRRGGQVKELRLAKSLATTAFLDSFGPDKVLGASRNSSEAPPAYRSWNSQRQRAISMSMMPSPISASPTPPIYARRQ